MSLRDPKLTLQQMREYAEQARGLAASTTASDLFQDRRTRLALERAVSVIGEAATRLSDAFQQQHPEIPWHQIIGMRNRIVHGYDAVDDEVLWKTAAENVPKLIRQLDDLIAQL
jgi:uncharacterized protein with HEPN domain